MLGLSYNIMSFLSFVYQRCPTRAVSPQKASVCRNESRQPHIRDQQYGLWGVHVRKGQESCEASPSSLLFLWGLLSNWMFWICSVLLQNHLNPVSQGLLHPGGYLRPQPTQLSHHPSCFQSLFYRIAHLGLCFRLPFKNVSKKQSLTLLWLIHLAKWPQARHWQQPALVCSLASPGHLQAQHK